MIFRLVKKFSSSPRTQGFIANITRICHWIPILAHMNQTYFFLLGFIKAASRLTLGSTQLPVKWASALLMEIKLPGCKVEHPPPYSTEDKSVWSYTSSPSSVFVPWCLIKHKHNFTFNFTISVLLSHLFLGIPVGFYLQLGNMLNVCKCNILAWNLLSELKKIIALHYFKNYWMGMTTNETDVWNRLTS
jgi:hypothetical protein